MSDSKEMSEIEIAIKDLEKARKIIFILHSNGKIPTKEANDLDGLIGSGRLALSEANIIVSNTLTGINRLFSK